MQLPVVALATLAMLSHASALVLNTPTPPTFTATPKNITWETSAGDPVEFNLVLVPLDDMQESYLIESFIPTAQGFFTFDLPCGIPEGTYFWEATTVSNLSDVLSTTAPFNLVEGSICF